MRAAAVEAIAAEILRWGIKPEKLPAGEKHLAGLVLDATLDTLADRADETIHVPRKGFTTGYRMGDVYADQLIAVLREDT